MGFTVYSLVIICFLASGVTSNCSMEGVTIWQIPISLDIEDYHEGIFLERSIQNIQGFSVAYYDDLNQGPYVSISITNSTFVISTNEAFKLYEENETSRRLNFAVTFACVDGTSTLPLNIQVNINDNNNHNPLWKTEGTVASPDTTYDFTIVTPVAPGFSITDCVRDIIVRDVDLTTYAIDFGIEDNPYFEIDYDDPSSTVDKEFKATLRTTTFIRSIPEPIVIRISATDVDETQDRPITTYTTVTIRGNTEFLLPDEPVFSQPLYRATYRENNQVVLEETISLQQGYDAQVQFSLEGDYAEDNFGIVIEGNQVSLTVTNPLPSSSFRQGQIHLVVKASREYTSGASSTIVVQLPEAVNLEFERAHYEGEIVDNTLQLTELILSQGYQESTLTVSVEDYPSFFTATPSGNIITLSMTTPLNANIIQENNFINLRVTASTGYSSATTIVTLEIIKDDIETPLFERPLYTGTYESNNLILDPLLLVQGYDDTVQVTFSGEHESYFELVRDGPSSTLRVIGGGLPSNILSEQHVLLSIEATKPRTVGATAVVSIALPAARQLEFEAPTYSGSLQDNILTLETIVLNVGYGDDVTFSLSGDYSSLFSISSVQNQVTVHPPAQFPQEVISENNFLMFTITAAGLNALRTSTAVLLEIIKDDVATPVFGQSIYHGNYLGSLDIDIGNINLAQGYDNSVSFRIEGENSQYFQINQNAGNNLTLTVQAPIPDELIFNEKAFVFNVFADKPLSVGANAAIFIRFSEELTEPTLLQFGKNTYIGSIENNTLSLENIVLETGFSAGTEFHLIGDHSSSFTSTADNDVISLSLSSELSAEVLDNNKFLLLELEARRDRAVPVTASIIIDLVEEEIPIILVFNQAFYTGVYTEESILQFEETISLLQGYDKTVIFELEGDTSAWFTLIQEGNSVTLVSTSNVPQDVLDSYHQLLFTIVASKPNAINGEAAISINLPKEILEQEVLRFAQNSYEGRVNETDLQVPAIFLVNEITDYVELTISGNHAEYFAISHESNIIIVELVTNIPSEVISSNEFFMFDITASKQDAVSGYTTLILRIDKEPQIVTPVFEQAYYSGEYSEQSGLLFEHTLRLIQGFDETVSFTLQGDGSELFILTQTEQNNLTLSTREGGLQQIENTNHLVFSVLANKPGSISGEAAIVINLSDLTDTVVLGFEQANYLGTIDNNVANIEPIVLSEGYTTAVTFLLQGDLSTYFSFIQQGSSVTIVLQTVIPEHTLPANRIVLLELQAIAPDAISAVTTVVFKVVREDDVNMAELVFSAPYYTGQFSETEGLLFETAISLDEGYDENVRFALDGEHAQWFTLVVEGNSVTLTTSGAIPPAVLANNQQLVFVVTAQKPNSNIARATIVISLVDDLTDAAVLGFERASYLGTIENNAATIEPIVLNEGYTTAVTFTLHGDLANYFSLVQQGSSVTIVLQTAIPEQALPANRIVLLELRAIAPDAISAVTTVVFEVVREDDVAVAELVFSAPYYTGQFSETEGLLFETAISLDEGYDENVRFALDGEHAQWFTLVVEGNSVTLTTSGAIPPAVLANNQQLVFVVTAQKPNSNIARATIVISLVDDLTDAAVLGFERASYLGTIENNAATIEPIVLNEGYTTAVTFTLHGDLANYFSFVQQGSSVTIVLQTAIPEQALPANRIVLLELRAIAPDAISAVTTVVFEVVREDDVAVAELVFSAPYYTGQFSETEGLLFETAISLDEGYDENVRFALDGEHAQWFTLVVEGNSVTLKTSGAIPPAVLANNQQLVFVVTAQKLNSNIARATIVISLVDDLTDAAVLGFERASYLGTIENNAATIEPIVLNEGYTTAVTFTLQGDLANYFSLVQQGSSVTIVLQTAIPEQALPANRIVLLELRAIAPDAISAVTAVVFEVVREDDVAVAELVFSAPYYTGQFSETEGLLFETAISLDEGYDENVRFALDGEHAQWFTLMVEGNSVTLTTSGAIPPAVLANNQQLVFVVTAQKLNSNIARATIVISLVDDLTDAAVLGFERASYLGTIENNAATIEPIVLNEGYTTAVTFTLQGDLANYFSFVQQGSSVTIVLQTAIPEQALPANRIVLLELRAIAPDAISAVTTVVFEVVREDDVAVAELVFSAPYYTGQFSETEGLLFETAISLDEGYDENVRFALDGEHAQWFTLVVEGNSVTLKTSGAIPPAVLANNQQLVFVVTAQKLNSNIARATIVISLVDDLTDAAVLGFERASYLGTIENNAATIEPIVLNEGYTTAVTFTLQGDLANYFSLVQQGSSVTIVLQTAIPEQALPANRIVLLELRAIAPDAISAVTTVVFEVVREDDVAVAKLVFSAPYYTGQFSETEGLLFETAISLDEGYDENVRFALDGEHAQWFTLVVEGNSVTLTTSGAIPPAVLANNQQLVFVVTAQKPNSNIARATIVISLVDDLTDVAVLGFERASYLGTIENNAATIEPIVLNEGYTTAVTFTLQGDLANYFSLVQQGSSVTIVLQTAIPEQALPANRIVLLELRAIAPDAISAVTTVVFEVVREDDVAMAELVFSAPYYTGQFSETEGLLFETAISLDEGYDENVQFALDGEHAQWFTLVVEGNSVTLTTSGAIPPAVLANNQQLVFVVTAQKPNSNIARATIVISLVDGSESATESFDRVLYEGTINLNVIQHEPITITGYTGSNVEILGEYSQLFVASLTEGSVAVVASGTLALPEHVTRVPLELRAGAAGAVLLLDVILSETPELPTVVFESPSYVMQADMAQTGLIGRVRAAASNGENIAYTLAVTDAHLQERVSITGEGEIHLSAPTNTGVYSFEVIATSAITQVQATAAVQLTVEVAATCGEDDHVLPPLIILDRDEEKPHENLVVLDSATQAGCSFRLTNRWPAEHDWLYVDENGLHAKAIDREDPRIAFMALSQIQAELVLECASDTQRRVRRSLNTNSRLDWLGPYDYGSNRWILTDTIQYNSRRSFVNLIVNDINDNYPIFIGSENSPVVVGYPIPELEDVVLPRALAELKATDADVGENAQLVYSSLEPVLAVAPATGSVHVRDGATLTDEEVLTVNVTDLNGREDGLTTSIQLTVKLIDVRHIAVVTVRNAFLDQEETILSNLTAAVGYEVKVLSSAVVSDDTDTSSANARNKRELTSEGASLQLYVYGLIDREPVAVDRLSTDIAENVVAIDVSSTISLEDHLEGREIPVSAGRDTGLLVATIVLSVLLFILIVAIAVWFFLRWRKSRNYEQFSDANSLPSRNEPLEQPPKVDSLKKPRLNLEELKRSERRLQEMLEAPVDDPAPKPSTSAVDPAGAFDTIINMAPPDTPLPIVIQSIDRLKDNATSEDEDEFGERTNKSRRKSVVTFNENVEKIIHVEDIPDDNSSDVEIFKF